ncbi:hypothetical protein [Corynebacterium cystitidis]|uniref:hypothetical protein n=1 Tax=Corynebacterium cystitidis TaxID=35757 RepID=UPI00211DF158|nr:hypothetical protein [Corynebacterium cystitidis]
MVPHLTPPSSEVVIDSADETVTTGLDCHKVPDAAVPTTWKCENVRVATNNTRPTDNPDLALQRMVRSLSLFDEMPTAPISTVDNLRLLVDDSLATVAMRRQVDGGQDFVVITGGGEHTASISNQMWQALGGDSLPAEAIETITDMDAPTQETEL